MHAHTHAHTGGLYAHGHWALLDAYLRSTGPAGPGPNRPGPAVLHVGDHLGTDVAAVRRSTGWAAAAVVEELAWPEEGAAGDSDVGDSDIGREWGDVLGGGGGGGRSFLGRLVAEHAALAVADVEDLAPAPAPADDVRVGPSTG
jgi:hypothetical protein